MRFLYIFGCCGPWCAVACSLAALHSLLYYRVSNEKKNVHRSSSYLKVYLLYMDVAAEFRAWILLVGVRRHYGQNCQVSSINHDAFLFFLMRVQIKIVFWLEINLYIHSFILFFFFDFPSNSIFICTLNNNYFTDLRRQKGS